MKESKISLVLIGIPCQIDDSVSNFTLSHSWQRSRVEKEEAQAKALGGCGLVCSVPWLNAC